MHSDPRSERATQTGFFGWCRRHPFSVAFLVGLCLLTGTCLLLDVRADQRVERVLEEIRDSGAPITIEELNAMAPSIPDEENMALVILEHNHGIGGIRVPEDKKDLLLGRGCGWGLPTGQRLPPEELEVARWYLDACAEGLAGVYEDLKLERGCLPVMWASFPLDTDLTAFFAFQHVARTIALDARVGAEEGDRSGAVRSVQALLDLDRALHCNRSISELLNRIVIRNRAHRSIERTINMCGLDSVALEDLQSELARFSGTFNFRAALEIERVLVLETVQSAFSGDLADNSGGWAYVPLLEPVSTAKGLKAWKSIVDAIDKPDFHTMQRLQAAEQNAASLPAYCLLWKVLSPNFERACELWIRHAADNLTLQTALACERFRLTTGDWPTTLDQLVPAYLEVVPIDPFGKTPIRFARIDEGIRIWSIGENLVDDGGDVKRLVVRGPDDDRATDTGWVLLNPDLRGRVADTGEGRSREEDR